MNARHDGSSLCRTEMRQGEQEHQWYLRNGSGVRGCSRECEGTVQVAACELLGLLTGGGVYLTVTVTLSMVLVWVVGT